MHTVELHLVDVHSLPLITYLSNTSTTWSRASLAPVLLQLWCDKQLTQSVGSWSSWGRSRPLEPGAQVVTPALLSLESSWQCRSPDPKPSSLSFRSFLYLLFLAKKWKITVNCKCKILVSYVMPSNHNSNPWPNTDVRKTFKRAQRTHNVQNLSL